MELDVKDIKISTGVYYSYITEARKLNYGSLSYAEAVQLVRTTGRLHAITWLPMWKLVLS